VVLAQADPHFLTWLEDVDASRPIEEIARTVEARARMLVFKSYTDLNRIHNIFSDCPFSQDGHLIMG
jgi:hypothetical protein